MSDWITISVAQTYGSVPREAGTEMRVFAQGQDGTIGGGALEWEAAKIARDMLREGKKQSRRTMPLGPNLGQCCGGTVVLDFIANAQIEETLGQPLWIWGAGHVGHAIATVMAPLPDFDVTMIDTKETRFPENLPADTSPLLASDMVKALTLAPKDAHHIIVTYSHDIDLRLCDGLLHQGFASCGLIGSATKWVRFQKRLKEMGHHATKISQIICPIGNPALGKHPTQIAIGVATQLLAYETKATSDRIKDKTGGIAS